MTVCDREVSLEERGTAINSFNAFLGARLFLKCSLQKLSLQAAEGKGPLPRSGALTSRSPSCVYTQG
jgi:hypothetical protein